MQMKMAYLVKVSNSKIRHHCLHLTETQMQIEKWESFIMKKKAKEREREGFKSAGLEVVGMQKVELC